MPIDYYDTISLFDSFGQEKSIKMIEFKIASLKEEVASLQSGVDSSSKYLSGSSERQKTLMNIGKAGADPMTMGGIANAIAGPGAGVYAAMKTQMENSAAQAESQNLARLSMELDRVMASMRDKNKERVKAILEKEIPELEEELEIAKKSKITEITEQEAKDKIKIRSVYFPSRETREKQGEFCEVDITIGVDSDYFEKKYGSSRVDGSFFANLYSNGFYIGSVKLVLPLFGVCSSKSIIGSFSNGDFIPAWEKLDKNLYDSKHSYESQRRKNVISYLENNRFAQLVPNKVWIVERNW